MNSRSIFSCILLASIALPLTGCGSSTKVTNTSQLSVGQQLNDLENARQRGIITDKEYAKLRKAIIKNND